MKQGTVKFFNAMKGFGFIKVDGTDEEILKVKAKVPAAIFATSGELTKILSRFQR